MSLQGRKNLLPVKSFENVRLIFPQDFIGQKQHSMDDSWLGFQRVRHDDTHRFSVTLLHKILPDSLMRSQVGEEAEDRSLEFDLLLVFSGRIHHNIDEISARHRDLVSLLLRLFDDATAKTQVAEEFAGRQLDPQITVVYNITCNQCEQWLVAYGDISDAVNETSLLRPFILQTGRDIRQRH